MVRAQFFNQHAIHEAVSRVVDRGVNRAGDRAVEIARWISVSSATAALIGLSALNAMHGPAYDCVRAGAYLLRSRRSGPYVPLVQIENSADRSASVVRLIPAFVLPLKEGFHVRD